MAVGHDVRLGNDGGLLQITVGDVARGVVGADQSSLDVRREGVSPVVTLAGVVEVHATHASAGGISGTQESGLLGHQFGQVGWTGAQAGGQATEGVDVAPDEGCDPDAVIGGLVLSHLQGTEEAGGTGDGRGDKAESAQDAAPPLCTNTAEALQLGEDVVEGLLPVRGEFDGLPGRVDDPTKDQFAGAPATVAAQELLE